MAAGAVYDAVFAAAILFFRRPSADILGIPLPEDPAYIGLNGIFLAMLAGFYGFAARDARRYRGVVVVAWAGRLVGGCFLLWVWLDSRVGAFFALALGDFLFGLLHLRLWWEARREG